MPTDSNCEACALKIQDLIGGGIHRIEPRGGRVLGPSVNNPDGDWSFHEVVVRDGRVYDGFTGPAGMGIADYKAQFRFADDIDFGF